jgi:hypothetical protein
MDVGAANANRRDRLRVGHTPPPGWKNDGMRAHLIARPIALTRSSALSADMPAMPRFVDTDRGET